MSDPLFNPPVLIVLTTSLLWIVLLALAVLMLRRGTVSAYLYRDTERRLAASLQHCAELQGDKQLAETRAAIAETMAARVPTLENALHEREGQVTAARLELSVAQTLIEQERKQAAEKLQLVEDARERMTLEFRSLAQNIMADHSETFRNQNREQVDGLLQPLREKIVEFQQGLAQAHTESGKERVSLGEQVRALMERGASMERETTNLTRALKGDVRIQGAWGEMILEAILERSGLTEGDHYTRQGSIADEDGRRFRPDVLLRLPGEQIVVIDSKVSLSAFEGYINAEDEALRGGHLARHRGSLRSHIDGLAAKNYAGVSGSRLDCVIMFVPIEGALAVALTHDPEIAAYAAEKNVAIATPVTLLMTLKTVMTVLRSEQRNTNAEQIAKRAGLLYDKFHGFASDLLAVGKSLDAAKASYDQATAKLSTGNGNVVSQVETLKRMGAKTTKALPPALLLAAGVDEPIDVG